MSIFSADNSLQIDVYKEQTREDSKYICKHSVMVQPYDLVKSNHQKHDKARKSCGKPQEAYRPWHNLSKHDLSRGDPIQTWLGGTPYSPGCMVRTPVVLRTRAVNFFFGYTADISDKMSPLICLIGGSRGWHQGRPPPLGPNSFIFMQFSIKIWPNK